MYSAEDKMTFIRDLYSPALRQIKFHEDSFPHRDRLLLGPTASGKSWIGLTEAVWHSVMYPNSRGVYFTPNVRTAYRDFKAFAEPWIAEANVNPVNGLVTMNPLVASEPNYVRFASHMDTYQFSMLRSELLSYFVVDELAWHFDFHELLMSRLKRVERCPHRQGLYIYSGLGIPRWMRQMRCNQHFFKTFWNENYMADFAPDSENLRELTQFSYDQHTMSPSVGDAGLGRRIGAEIFADVSQGIAMVRRHLRGQHPMTTMFDREWKPGLKPIDEPEKDEGLDAFLAEIDEVVNEPNDPSSIDEDSLPKAAPTHGA